MSQPPTQPQPGYNAQYAGAPVPGAPIGQPIQPSSGVPLAHPPHPNPDPNVSPQGGQYYYPPPGGPPPAGYAPYPGMPQGPGVQGTPQGPGGFATPMPQGLPSFPGADPSQAYHPVYQPPAAHQHRWYLGTTILDPQLLRAPMGSTKVPGYDPKEDYETIKRALHRNNPKNFNATLISTLVKLSVFEMDALDDYFAAHEMPLAAFIEANTTSYFGMALKGLALGPLGFDVELARNATKGFGTKEVLLTELILGRESSEISLLAEGYLKKHGRVLMKDVSNDLSGSAQKFFTMALEAQRPSYTMPVDLAQARTDADSLYNAAKGRGVNEMEFFRIMNNRSLPHIREVIQIYNQQYKSLSKTIKKEFKGSSHVRDGLLYILHGVKAKRDGRGIYRDVKLLEDSMKGFGTKDEQLVWRIVRAHWNPAHMEEIKATYLKKYGKTLEHRVKGETSGPYQELLLAIIRSSEHKH